MHTTVKFAKVRPTAKIPTKRLEDAGYDIYASWLAVAMSMAVIILNRKIM